MVAVIHKRAHSVVDNLSYNLKKIDSGEAEIVKIENLPDGAEYNPAIISGYMRWWERRSQRMKKTAFHMSVNPSDEDNANLPKETILKYINGLMTHLGYANQPYIVVEHNDIERRHFHVVSVRVDENGKGIPTHKDGIRVKEYSIANQERFGFVYGKDPLAEEKNLNIHSKFERGRGRIKDQIRRFASGVLKSYSFSTQSQFSKIMRHYGIKAEWKRKEDNKVSLTYEGKDYIWMELNKPNISMNRNTPQWMIEQVDKCHNVFDIAKVFGPLVLSESNVTRARNPVETTELNKEQDIIQQKSSGRKLH